MAVIPAGFAQVNWIFAGSSCPTGAEVTLGLGGAGLGGSAGAVAALLTAIWDDNMQDVQVATCFHTGTLLKKGPNATGASALHAAGTIGTLGVAGIAPNVALLVNKATDEGGRAGRGRFYMPGMTEPDTSQGGLVDEAYLTAAQTAADDMYAALVAADLVPVVLHGATSPIATPSTITEFQVQALVATQRRRLRR